MKKVTLNNHLKRMVVKAYVMGWSLNKVHSMIDKIIKQHKSIRPTEQSMKDLTKEGEL